MDTFTYTWYCGQHGHALEPAATVNLSASVMARVYVCPINGQVIVRTSNGMTFLFSVELLARGWDALAARGDDDGA